MKAYLTRRIHDNTLRMNGPRRENLESPTQCHSISKASREFIHFRSFTVRARLEIWSREDQRSNLRDGSMTPTSTSHLMHSRHNSWPSDIYKGCFSLHKSLTGTEGRREGWTWNYAPSPVNYNFMNTVSSDIDHFNPESSRKKRVEEGVSVNGWKGKEESLSSPSLSQYIPAAQKQER